MHSMSKFLVICDGAVYQNFQCSALFFFFCFALLFYLCALFCALLCCIFMFHCIMYYLLCNLIVHAWYLWTCTCTCYLCLYVNVLYMFICNIYICRFKNSFRVYVILFVSCRLYIKLIWFDLIWITPYGFCYQPCMHLVYYYTCNIVIRLRRR